MTVIKKIVCLGGGNAMPKAVLAGLRKYPVEISVISAHGDDGGSAGKLLAMHKTSVSFGDIRRAAYQLSDAPLEIREAKNSRDQNGFVFSNLESSAIVGQTHNPEDGINHLRDIFKVPEKYKLLFATFDDTTLCAELEDGTIIEKETNIDIPKHDSNLRIKNVSLKPAATAHPKALEEIKKADAIVIGPGDLYSSLAQILLVKGIPEAIRESSAPKIYICNLMVKSGETNNFLVSDFVREIEKYLGGEVDHVIFNNEKPSFPRMDECKTARPELLGLVIPDAAQDSNKNKFRGENLLTDEGPITHDPDKLAKIIISLCKQ
jgi:uncharacterized cofD-like protein